MGGAASSAAAAELEELVACTYLLGQALASMNFPDMYRIHDFHSRAAPPLQSASFVKEEAADDATFSVTVHNQRIVLDDLTAQNADGWTPLHACCHSQSCVPAALAIVAKLCNSLSNSALFVVLEARTKRGPGSGNSGWTALHMACAYGIEPVAHALIQAGANIECENSHHWTPMLDVCHRGFLSIAKLLLPKLTSKALSVVPEASPHRSVFARPPPQSFLGEACRCGFKDVAILLLEAGAPKDVANSIGWTPLHEACFYGHLECAKLLLVYGADATRRDYRGALPFDVASLQKMRDLVRDLGGPEAGLRGFINDSVHKSSATPPLQTSDRSPEYLHQGEMLGNLPALGGSLRGGGQSVKLEPEKRAVTGSKTQENAEPADTPPDFLCNISRRLLAEPYRSPYGHVFEAKLIRAWLAKNGSICPLTGQPLVASELEPDTELKAKITNWQLAKNLDSMRNQQRRGPAAFNSSGDDELYDF